MKNMKQLIIITDPNKDLDDLINLIMTAKMQKQKLVNVQGIITTHGNRQTIVNRALYTKGTCNYLGFLM